MKLKGTMKVQEPDQISAKGLFKDKTVVLFQLGSVIIDGPKPEFDHVARMQLSGPGNKQLVYGNVCCQRHSIASRYIVALKDVAENAVDGVRKFPLRDKLITCVGIGGADTDHKLQGIARSLRAGIVVVEPAHVEAVQTEGIRIALAAGSEQKKGEQEKKDCLVHMLDFGTNLGARSNTRQVESAGLVRV